MAVTPAVFLDRDGVVNAMCYDADHGIIDSPTTPDQFRLLPGVARAIRRLRAAGFLVVVVSNQPGVGKGKLTGALLDAITTRMYQELQQGGAALDGTYYCLHHPEAVIDEYRGACECRKPKAGLLLRAQRELQIDLTRSFMVGDGLTDVQAGKLAGCRTIWIGQMKCDWCQAMDGANAMPDWVSPNLVNATDLICASTAARVVRI
jgi:D-glycero-D-manno-heptose 1,7-bisphosphate phosphatase